MDLAFKTGRDEQLRTGMGCFLQPIDLNVFTCPAARRPSRGSAALASLTHPLHFNQLETQRAYQGAGLIEDS
jgi:hypothetical protein